MDSKIIPQQIGHELGFEVWIGDPAEIKAKRVKKLKNGREDARLLRRLMLEITFLEIWVPDPENRDLRQSTPRKTLGFETPASRLRASVASTH